MPLSIVAGSDEIVSEDSRVSLKVGHLYLLDDTKQCRQVIADRQAHAVIPPRKNAKPWKDTKSSSLERNDLPFVGRLKIIKNIA